jgi:hypothetical protein
MIIFGLLANSTRLNKQLNSSLHTLPSKALLQTHDQPKHWSGMQQSVLFVGHDRCPPKCGYSNITVQTAVKNEALLQDQQLTWIEAQ